MNDQQALRDALICPLCERAIPPPQRDAHHLVPMSQEGRHTEFLHRVCHRQVRALTTPNGRFRAPRSRGPGPVQGRQRQLQKRAAANDSSCRSRHPADGRERQHPD